MPPVAGGTAHVVDRRRIGGHLLREAVRRRQRGHDEPRQGPADHDARTSPRSSSTARASETTAITMAFRGPTFMNVWRHSRGSTRTPRMSSSSASAFRFGPTRNSTSGSSRTPRTLPHDLRAIDE